MSVEDESVRNGWQRVKRRIVERSDADWKREVNSDGMMELTGVRRRKAHLRMLAPLDCEHPEPHYVALTTNFRHSPRTIAKIQRSRWRIELPKNWIKQHLEIKRRVGGPRNAVMIQLWIALCANLTTSKAKIANIKSQIDGMLCT